MKISDKIRKWADDLDSDDVVCTTATLYILASRIDAEMIELPKDKDERPIHVGDTLYGEDGKAWHVRGVTIGEKSTAHPGHVIRAASDAGQPRYLKPEWLTHERPDSWERIADELDAWCDKVDVDGDACGKPRAIADRIRRLAEKEGQQ